MIHGRWVLTDLAGRPVDTVLVGIHTVHDELAATTDIVDRVIKDLDTTSGFDDNVESIRVVRLELGELGAGVAARQSNVLITSIERLGQVHLQTLRSNHSNLASTIQTKQLGQDQTGRASTEKQDRRAHLGGNFVQTVSGTRGRLKQGGIDIGEVLDLEHSASYLQSAWLLTQRCYMSTYQGTRSTQRNHHSW